MVARGRHAWQDPAEFCRTWLRHDLWPVQEQILRSVAEHRRTAVKACHSSGKTFVAADAVLWWLMRYPDGVVLTTAPSWRQVETVLWGQIHQAVAESLLPIPRDALLRTSLRLSAGNYALGLSTNLGVRFQGFHGRILVVVDEAPGVAADIWEAIEGIRAGGDVRILALGNPTIASGPFYDAFTRERGSWSTLTISAFDTPNLAGLDLAALLALPEAELDRGERPYLTTRRWVREKHTDWGPGHALWDARVLGQFPAQAEDALISLAWLEAAKWRDPEDSGGPLDGGLDVAGPGEAETALVLRAGDSLVLQQTWTDADPRGAVLAALAPYRQRLQNLNVDTAGLGYYMARHLADAGIPVTDVNVGEAPTDSERFVNLKAELYWGLRERLAEGAVRGLRDETAIGQLAGIRYRHTARGQVVIESKDEARRRGVPSPDRAEGLMLAFAPLKRWLWA